MKNLKLDRLHKLLEGEAVEDGWSGDVASRQALTDQWRLALHVADGHKADRQTYARNHEDAAESERRVRVDHAGRYPIELLQNAQDACADAGTRGKAWLRVTDTALLVANQGVPFNAERIQSLVRLGGTTKKPGDPQHHTIGYKGIGFTSVLEISDEPQVISDGVAFGLDWELAKRELSRILEIPIARVPARYFPFPLSPDEWGEDARVVEELFSAGAVTIVRLPLRPGADRNTARAAIEQVLTPTTLLLMPALDSLDIGDGLCWTRRLGRRVAGAQLHHLRAEEGESESWLVKETRVPVASSAVGALREDVWSSVKDLHVLVGIPWRDGRPHPASEFFPTVHAYFPTDDSLGRSLLVHGDFFLESNRRRVHAEGPGGTISGTAARGIVELVADLASAFCKELPDKTPEFLGCLAPQQPPQGYGERLGSLLDNALASRPILRTAKGLRVAPQQAKIVGVELRAREARDLARMLSDITSLLNPAYEPIAGRWLRALGATEVDANTVARYLRPDRAPTYDRAVVAVAAWWKGKSRWMDGAALRQLRILQSTDGTWHTAGELCEPVAGVPALPPGLERATYVPPGNAAAAEFVKEELEVEEMDLARALDLVLDALEEGEYARDEHECEAAHDFVRSAFGRKQALVRSHPKRTLVPVRVRSWRRGPPSGWREAGETYFPRDWTGNADLEHLYRRFSEQEFLAVEPPEAGRKRKASLDFYKAIGVAGEPRRLKEEGTMWQAPLEWRDRPDVRAAEACPDGHRQTSRRFESLVIDRLGSLLQDLKASEARALANILSRDGEPYGAEAKVWCTHSAHRSRGRGKKTIGLQHWMLGTTSWVLVQRDPLGRQLVPPGQAWVDVNGKALRACLPEAAVPRAAATKFNLPSATKPNPEALVDALLTLVQAAPVLADASPELIEGSFLLLQRLQAALHRRHGDSVGVPPFPALRAGLPVWAKRPAIPDVALPADLPLDVLKEGTWDELHHTFGLPHASTLVQIATDTRGAMPAELPGLTAEDRIRLTALLTVNGADLKLTARRLGRLRVMRCDEISTAFSIDGFQSIERRNVYLDSREDGGTLFVVEPFGDDSRMELVAELAKYLGARSQQQNIHLYLALGEDLLYPLGVGDAALDEAEEALERYVKAEDSAPLTVPKKRRTREAPFDEEDSAEDRPTAVEENLPADTTEVEKSEPPEMPAIKTTFGGRSLIATAPDLDPSMPPLGEVTFTGNGTAKPGKPHGGRPSGARGGTGRSGSPSVSSETRREVERRAVDIASRYAREKLGCIEVRDVQGSNKGWDLEFVLPGGEWWPVEIKGFAASVSTFILTRNEIAAAKSNEGYRVLLVTGVSAGTGSILEIKDPASWIADDHLEAMSWAIHGWDDHADSVSSWSSP